MPPRQLRQLRRDGFARQVAGGLDVGVLQDDRLEFRGALDDRVQLRRVAMPRHPELHAHHRPVAHAAVQLRQARLHVLGVEIDEAKGPMMPPLQCRQDFVVLLAHVLGRRVIGPVHPHEHA